MEHQWIKEGLKIRAPIARQTTLFRKREEEQEGVKGNVFEGSPVREV